MGVYLYSVDTGVLISLYSVDTGKVVASDKENHPRRMCFLDIECVLLPTSLYPVDTGK